MSEVTRAEQLAQRLMACATVDFDGDFTAAAVELRRLSAVEARCVELEDLAARLRQEAQIHAQEARTANTTIAEIYQCVTGKTGEPGNWNGAEPVRAFVARQSELLRQAKEAMDRSLSWLSSYPGEGTMAPGGPYEQVRAALSAINEGGKSNG